MYLNNRLIYTFYKRVKTTLVPVKVRNELIILMTHARTEMSDTNISLFRPPENDSLLAITQQRHSELIDGRWNYVETKASAGIADLRSD